MPPPILVRLEFLGAIWYGCLSNTFQFLNSIIIFFFMKNNIKIIFTHFFIHLLLLEQHY